MADQDNPPLGHGPTLDRAGFTIVATGLKEVWPQTDPTLGHHRQKPEFEKLFLALA